METGVSRLDGVGNNDEENKAELRFERREEEKKTKEEKRGPPNLKAGTPYGVVLPCISENSDKFGYLM